MAKERYLPKVPFMGWIFWVCLTFMSIIIYSYLNFSNFVIPTPAMEGSLMVGDYIRASLGSSSKNVKANEIFIFHWPIGDSVYQTSQREYTVSQITRQPEYIQVDQELTDKIRNKEVRIKPIKSKLFYIKRCVAGPGDSLLIKDKQIYLNGKAVNNPKHLQHLYQIQMPLNVSINNKTLDSWGIDIGDNYFGNNNLINNGQGVLFLDNDQVNKLKSLDKNIIIEAVKQPSEPTKLFPFDRIVGSQNWNVDNYGPIWIPKAGATTPLSIKNLPFYRRIISVYEKNKLEVKGQDIYINDQKVTSYTFKQDYYWAMGDNRHNSEDSRAWGYVPHDHVAGKPMFIIFSTKDRDISKGVNWERIFKSTRIE